MDQVDYQGFNQADGILASLITKALLPKGRAPPVLGAQKQGLWPPTHEVNATLKLGCGAAVQGACWAAED